MNKFKLAIKLIIPLAGYIALIVYQVMLQNTGEKITLPIHGHDPRDLLAGHYLVYQIDYGVQGICEDNLSIKEATPAYLCLRPSDFSYTPFEKDYCQLLIKGFCHRQQFQAGIEKFYTSEQQAKNLEKEITTKQAFIELSVTKKGKASVLNLFLK